MLSLEGLCNIGGRDPYPELMTISVLRRKARIGLRI